MHPLYRAPGRCADLSFCTRFLLCTSLSRILFVRWLDADLHPLVGDQLYQGRLEAHFHRLVSFWQIRSRSPRMMRGDRLFCFSDKALHASSKKRIPRQHTDCQQFCGGAILAFLTSASISRPRDATSIERKGRALTDVEGSPVKMTCFVLFRGWREEA